MNYLIKMLKDLSDEMHSRSIINQLMAMDDDSLKDIGLSRSTISYEVRHTRKVRRSN